MWTDTSETMEDESFEMLLCSRCSRKYKSLTSLQKHCQSVHGCPLEGTPKVVKVLPRKKRGKGVKAHLITQEPPKPKGSEEAYLLQLLGKIDDAKKRKLGEEEEANERKRQIEEEERERKAKMEEEEREWKAKMEEMLAKIEAEKKEGLAELEEEKTRLEQEERQMLAKMEKEKETLDEEKARLAIRSEEMECALECSICFTDNVPAVIMPCRHQVACEGCILQMMNRGQGCPSCRGPIESFLNVFIG